MTPRTEAGRALNQHTALPMPDRFWHYVYPGDDQDCWPWRGGRSLSGYGAFLLEGQSRLAHRVAYELAQGPIPPGLTLDHLCRNRLCVNPRHLEPVSDRMNVMRGMSLNARRARQTHCIHGHSLSGANLYVKPNGNRVCRACQLARQRGSYRRRKAAVAP